MLSDARIESLSGVDWSALLPLPMSGANLDVSTLDSAAAADLQTETLSAGQSYDAVNRLISVTSLDSSVLHYAFDEGSRLVTITGSIARYSLPGRLGYATE